MILRCVICGDRVPCACKIDARQFSVGGERRGGVDLRIGNRHTDLVTKKQLLIELAADSADTFLSIWRKIILTANEESVSSLQKFLQREKMSAVPSPPSEARGPEKGIGIEARLRPGVEPHPGPRFTRGTMVSKLRPAGTGDAGRPHRPETEGDRRPGEPAGPVSQLSQPQDDEGT